MSSRLRRLAVAGASALALAVSLTMGACGQLTNSPTSSGSTSRTLTPIIVESPWVRATTDTTDTTMTAAFMTITNPGPAEVRLVGASSDVAGITEIHEMVMVNGKRVMRKAENGVVIEAGGQVSLTPGGYHVMLMQLKKGLLIGDEVIIRLDFSNAMSQTVKAPVKKFTEEEDHYHETPGAFGSPLRPKPSTSISKSSIPMPVVTPVKS